MLWNGSKTLVFRSLSSSWQTDHFDGSQALTHSHLTSSLWRPAHPDSVPRQCRGTNAVSEPKHSGIDCSRGFEEATHSLQTRGKRKFPKMILGKMRDVMLSKTIVWQLWHTKRNSLSRSYVSVFAWTCAPLHFRVFFCSEVRTNSMPTMPAFASHRRCTRLVFVGFELP